MDTFMYVTVVELNKSTYLGMWRMNVFIKAFIRYDPLCTCLIDYLVVLKTRILKRGSMKSLMHKSGINCHNELHTT